jgi:hypothetical protein
MKNMAIDFKKTQKELYMPKTAPSFVEVPEMVFFMVNGRGNPNTSPDYAAALDVLYGLSYSVKMSKMSGAQPDGYFDYVVPPLEGLWWFEDGGVIPDILDKDRFCWTSMVRQPDFVTEGVFESAKLALRKKKPELDLSSARLERFAEGLCAQIMHLGPYDDEPATIAVLEKFIVESGYAPDFTGTRRHHEIYLGDPRKTAPDKLKTVIRYPIRKA